MITNEKTNPHEPMVAARSIHESIESISTLNSDGAIDVLLGLLKNVYVENGALCDQLIESDNQLIDFLSCEDWDAFIGVKGQYRMGSDWLKVRDDYKSILEALKDNARRINAVRAEAKAMGIENLI